MNSLKGLISNNLPEVYGNVIICGTFILLIKLFSIWNLIQKSIVIVCLLVPYLIHIKVESHDPTYFEVLCSSLRCKGIFALFIIITSEYYDQESLLSLSDLSTYMLTLAAYSCFESLYFCHDMCVKS